MIRSFLGLIFFGFFIYSIAQDNKLETLSTVSQAPNLNSCTSYKEDKQKSFACMNKKFNEQLSDELSNIINFDKLPHQVDYKVRYSMVITKKGRIENLELISSNNDTFAQKTKIALLRLINHINKNPLEPAKLEDGTPVDFQFEIPIQIKTSN